MRFLFLLMLFQSPERTRGLAPAQLPEINITKEGPLVVPTSLVMKGMISVFTAYTALLVFGGKWIWKKRTDEVGQIKADLEKTNQVIAEELDVTNNRIATELKASERKYELNRVEINAMIVRLDSKVDRHHESFTEKIDRNHAAVMEALATIHDRRNGSRE